MTSKAEAVNAAVEEDKVADIGDFQEVNPQVVDIESSSKIRGTIIEEYDPLIETREASTLLMPHRKKKRSMIQGQSFGLIKRRRMRASWATEVVNVEIAILRPRLPAET